MARYWKAIGAFVGAVVAFLVAQGFVTADQAAGIEDAVLTILGAVLGTYVAPKNEDSA